MEQKAKRIGKFNVIDIIAVILILAVLAFTGWKLAHRGSGQAAETAMTKVTYTVKVEGVPAELYENCLDHLPSPLMASGELVGGQIESVAPVQQRLEGVAVLLGIQLGGLGQHLGLRLLGVEFLLADIHAVDKNTVLENDPHMNEMHVQRRSLLCRQVTGGICDDLNHGSLLRRIDRRKTCEIQPYYTEPRRKMQGISADGGCLVCSGMVGCCKKRKDGNYDRTGTNGHRQTVLPGRRGVIASPGPGEAADLALQPSGPH